MKNFLFESRESLDIKVTFNMFKRFMLDSIIEGNYDDSPIWNEMRHMVTELYGANIWNWFKNWCEGYLTIKNEVSLEEFYNRLKTIPLDRFNRVLGAGSNAIVLDVNDKKVIKLFYKNRIKSIDEPFIKYCLRRRSKVFPYVYNIGRNWYVTEKLKLNTPKCKKYMDIIDNHTFDGVDPISGIAKGQTVKNLLNLTNDEREVYEWCRQVKQEMDNINCDFISYPGDLVLNNIGERPNGDIVFFDV